MDELLSLLQINIALGILYIGLRGGRYREMLLRSLAALIGNREQQFREAPEYVRGRKQRSSQGPNKAKRPMA